MCHGIDQHEIFHISLQQGVSVGTIDKTAVFYHIIRLTLDMLISMGNARD